MREEGVRTGNITSHRQGQTGGRRAENTKHLIGRDTGVRRVCEQIANRTMRLGSLPITLQRIGLSCTLMLAASLSFSLPLFSLPLPLLPTLPPGCHREPQ